MAVMDTTIDGHTGCLMTVAEFNAACEAGAFIDYDGMGDLVKDGEIVTPRAASGCPEWVVPSIRHTIPEGITHVLWYNR